MSKRDQTKMENENEIFVENHWKQEKNETQEICGNHIKAGFFNVIIHDIALHGTDD